VKAVHYLVKGKVQGVGFRYFVAREAKRLGVSGWVRNLPDGRVETRAEGDEQTLAAFESSLNKGPSWSRVTECLTRTVPVENLTGFGIKW